MDFLSESLKGRLLFAIPKKGAATGRPGDGTRSRVTDGDPQLAQHHPIFYIGRLYEKCLELLAGALIISLTSCCCIWRASGD